MKLHIHKLWYKKSFLAWGLLPFSWIFQLIVLLRRNYLIRFRQKNLGVPIIVVGNITVGGTGKTPLVIAIAQRFCTLGLRVGIVSRGYGAETRNFPYKVKPDDDAIVVGDEALLLANKTACPVVIAPSRVQAVKYCLQHFQSQIIISDDGLQHYAMPRTIEIVVIDGSLKFGNGFCLPAGPLRENVKRLRQVDFLVANGGRVEGAYPMELQPQKIINLLSGETHTAMWSTPVAAVAGIGNPQRFFTTLSALGIAYNPYRFPDHYQFKAEDLQLPESVIIMTEKDAVKCRKFATKNMFFLPVEAQLANDFWHALVTHNQLKEYLHEWNNVC